MAEKEKKKRTVCVTGHKNPDTDSICSAIAYAYLKNQLNDNCSYVPTRAGQVTMETQYVLDYFHVEQPLFLDNIGTRVKDMEIREVPGVKSDISIKKAWTLMRSQNVYTLPITDEDDHLHGLITINDIARSNMEEYDSAIVSVAKTSYRNILETLEGQMIVGDENAYFEEGKVVIAAANPDVMEDYIEDHDMVILGNRYESQLCAIEMNAGCIVVCLGSPVSRTIQRLAKDRGCTVIVTPLETYAVARLVNQSMPVDFYMKKDNLITFHLTDYTDEIKEIMSKKRYRDFPILDKTGKYVGMISRRNLLGVRKRALIMVDHNEAPQAVDHVQDAEILEIIDHHRLGGPETISPVLFRNQPVGCTATIIFQMFRERQMEIPVSVAGLLCGAILSDTLNFRSPTCTEMDRYAAGELAQTANINCDQFAQEMFTAGSTLKDKTPEEIFYQDFKKFEIGDRDIGVGQIASINQQELSNIKENVFPILEKASKELGLDIVLFMLTNIIDESTLLLCFGKDAEDLVESAFFVPVKDHAAAVPGVVSRKKQVIPALMAAISRESEL